MRQAEAAAQVLEGLHDIVVPEAVAWTPQTVGWYVLLATVLAIAARVAVMQRRRRIANRYRREALDVLAVIENDVGTPELVITGILSGTPSSILAFGFGQTGGIGDSDTVNLPYETADLANNSVWTDYADEDYYEEVIAITPAVAYVPGQKVFYFCYRNGAVDTTTIDFIVDDLIFRYSDT